MPTKTTSSTRSPRPSRAAVGPLDGPLSGDPIHDAFITHCRAALPRIRGMILTKGLDDPHSIVDEVWLKAWEKFPTMYQAEQEALAAGLPSPHNFVG